MGIEENKEVVKRFIESGNKIQGDLLKIQPFIDEFLSSNHIHHTPMGDHTLDITTQFYHMVFSAFPDLVYKINDIIAEGDKVVMSLTNTATHKGEFQGIPATGKHVRFNGVDIFKVADGKITDEWSFPDQLSMMQQLGVIPNN
jgi:steroid delta-isomerase-like uncharacterized protein